MKKKKKWLWPVAIILLLIWLYCENNVLSVSEYRIFVPQEYGDLNGLTIVHISDLHNKEFGEGQERILKIVREAEPDIIAVTGDVIDSARTDVDVAVEFMTGAVQYAPVYFVSGNHEAWAAEAYQELELQLEQLGVQILDGEQERFSYNGVAVTVLGIPDPDMPGENVAVSRIHLEEMTQDVTGEYCILLAHRPELFSLYAENEMNLVLSGHAHGGQIRIPFVGGVVAPNQGLWPAYTEGVYTEGSTAMVVSRGLGNSIIPVRINNRPEVVIIELTTEEQSRRE